MIALSATVELLRPAHWIKNGFVLTGLLFGHRWGEIDTILAALAALAAFCLASSAAYAYNDSRDAELDRAHPDKRFRPVARGAIRADAAARIALALAIASIGFAWVLVPGVVPWVVAYLALNVAYSAGLKHVPVLDVFAIASGFMLRLLAGTLGLGIEPSNWLFACGLLLTLFLGFAKRRAEIARLADDAGRHRAVLDSYTLGFLDTAIVVCAAGMVVTYALYTLAAESAALHGTQRLVLTLPWVLLGTFRYLFRLHFRGGGGDPVLEVLRDPVLGAAAIGWVATVIVLIA